jgi:hypothetical protein
MKRPSLAEELRDQAEIVLRAEPHDARRKNYADWAAAEWTSEESREGSRRLAAEARYFIERLEDLAATSGGER